MTRWIAPAAAAAVVALALAAAGCGGGGSKSANEPSGGTATTAPAATTPATTTTSSGSGGTTTSEGTGGSTSTSTSTDTGVGTPAKRCIDFAAASAKLSQAIAASGTGAADSGSLKTYFEGLAAKAPSSIRSSFQILAEAIGKYLDVLKQANIKPGTTPSPDAVQKLEAAAKQIDTAKVKQASARIEAWVKSGCK